MFGAKLGDLDAGINVLHYFVAYAVYLVAKYQGIFFIFDGDKLVEHGAVFGLFNRYDAVAIFTQLFNSL